MYDSRIKACVQVVVEYSCPLFPDNGRLTGQPGVNLQTEKTNIVESRSCDYGGGRGYV